MTSNSINVNSINFKRQLPTACNSSALSGTLKVSVDRQTSVNTSPYLIPWFNFGTVFEYNVIIPPKKTGKESSVLITVKHIFILVRFCTPTFHASKKTDSPSLDGEISAMLLIEQRVPFQ